MHLLLEQLGVGHDDLLAGHAAQPGGLEADALDRADGRAVADRVAAAERLVEQDRQRGEEVGEDALRGQADGDAADAEAGDQGGDVDPRLSRMTTIASAKSATLTSTRMIAIALPSVELPSVRRRPAARSRRGSARAPRSRPEARRR